VQSRTQPAVDQGGFATARGADDSQKMGGCQFIDHGIDLAFPSKKQIFLFLSEWPQARKRIRL
jgi:hypothetical protein